MANALFVIVPYWYEGTWVFDDPAVGLQREPFVAGIPEMINLLVKDIPRAQEGFRLTFGERPFPNFQKELLWVREEMEGNWYRQENPAMEGWLCPALFKYFDKTPKKLFVRADQKPL